VASALSTNLRVLAVNRNILPFLLTETVNQTQNVVPNRTTANFFLGSQLGSALSNPSLLPTLTHLKMGQNQHYNLRVQQQLSPKTLFDIGTLETMGCICRPPMISTIRLLRLVRSKHVVLTNRGARSRSNRKTLGQPIRRCRPNSSGASVTESRE